MVNPDNLRLRRSANESPGEAAQRIALEMHENRSFVLSSTEVQQKIVESFKKGEEEGIELLPGAFKLPLTDPVSRMRIRIPARSLRCDHFQCFDLATFLEAHLVRPANAWFCPMCNAEAKQSQLRIDRYFAEILEKVGPEPFEVELLRDGSWREMQQADFKVVPVGDNDDIAQIVPRKRARIEIHNNSSASTSSLENEQITFSWKDLSGFLDINEGESPLEAIRAMKQRLNDAENQNKKLEEENSKLLQKVKQFEELEKQCKKFKEEEEAVEEEKSKLLAENEKLLEKVAEYEQLKIRCQLHMSEIEEYKDKLLRTEQLLCNIRKQLGENIETLQSEVLHCKRQPKATTSTQNRPGISRRSSVDHMEDQCGDKNNNVSPPQKPVNGQAIEIQQPKPIFIPISMRKPIWRSSLPTGKNKLGRPRKFALKNDTRGKNPKTREVSTPKNDSPASQKTDEGKKSPMTKMGYCGQILRVLMARRNGDFNWPFLSPVDPVKLELPDYFDVVKHPMDLSTIKKKFDANEYPEIEEFRADVELMCNNCFTYNPSEHRVYRCGKKLMAKFEALWSKLPTTELVQLKQESSKNSDQPSSSAPIPMQPERENTVENQEIQTNCTQNQQQLPTVVHSANTGAETSSAAAQEERNKTAAEKIVDNRETTRKQAANGFVEALKTNGFSSLSPLHARLANAVQARKQRTLALIMGLYKRIDRGAKAVQVLVVVPSPEAAHYFYRTIQALLPFLGISCHVCHEELPPLFGNAAKQNPTGSAAVDIDENTLEVGVSSSHILVGTAPRLRDILSGLPSITERSSIRAILVDRAQLLTTADISFLQGFKFNDAGTNGKNNNVDKNPSSSKSVPSETVQLILAFETTVEGGIEINDNDNNNSKTEQLESQNALKQRLLGDRPAKLIRDMEI